MADDEKRSAKRSRFDQTEPEPKRSSRFDQRSRSPSSRSADVRRSRSPLGQRTPFSPGSEGKSTPLDPAAAAGQCWNISSTKERILTYSAAAAAARINAQIQAKKGIQHVDVPPIRSVSNFLYHSSTDANCSLDLESRCKISLTKAELRLKHK